MKTPQPVHPNPLFHLSHLHKATTHKSNRLHLLKKVYPLLIQVGAVPLPLNKARNSEGARNHKGANERKAADRHNQTEREIAEDNQREAALQDYIDKMLGLLLHEDLRKSSEDAEVRRLATLQTLTALPRLDGRRKGSVLLFLYEAGLIDKSNPIVSFGAAGLHAADLRGCDLSAFRGATLCGSFI